MQLVEFDDAQGHKVWVNPGQVTIIKPHTGNANVTDIQLAHGHVVRVSSRLDDVAQKLNLGART